LVIQLTIEQAHFRFVFETKISEDLGVIVYYPLLMVKIDDEIGGFGTMSLCIKLDGIQCYIPVRLPSWLSLYSYNEAGLDMQCF